jgi:hypothetical protein
MQASVPVETFVEQWSALIEPGPGVSIWQALHDANPTGFVRIEIYPDMTARVIVHERYADG